MKKSIPVSEVAYKILKLNAWYVSQVLVSVTSKGGLNLQLHVDSGKIYKSNSRWNIIKISKLCEIRLQSRSVCRWRYFHKNRDSISNTIFFAIPSQFLMWNDFSHWYKVSNAKEWNNLSLNSRFTDCPVQLRYVSCKNFTDYLLNNKLLRKTVSAEYYFWLSQN